MVGQCKNKLLNKEIPVLKKAPKPTHTLSLLLPKKVHSYKSNKMLPIAAIQSYSYTDNHAQRR